ncbi:MAG TPA: branched-chain amino acid ABC transporter permease, partial [Roseiflexaceae bacterium]
GYALSSPVGSYYLVCAVVALVAGASHRLARSRIGRAWAAIGEDEIAAASSGVNPTGAKHQAFIIGSVIAGVAGALFASIFSYVDPEQFDFRVSAMVLAMVVIGGAGSVPGAILGALAIAGFDQLGLPLIGAWLDRVRQSAGGGLSFLDVRALNSFYFGLALYLAVLFRARRGNGRRRRPVSAENLSVAPPERV